MKSLKERGEIIEDDEKVENIVKIQNIKGDEIITLGQVAAYFKISEQVISNLVKEGELPAFKIGDHWRIRESDISVYINLLMKSNKIELEIKR